MKCAAVSPINWEHIVIRAARRRRAMSHAARSVVERLEDRTLFAYNLTLSFGSTTNVTSSTSANTTTFTAANSGANLSWGDIANQLNVNHNVVVNTGAAGAEAGNITDQLVGGISINNAAGTNLTFQSGSGTNLVGNVSLGTVNFVGANSSITVTAAGSIKAQTLEQGFGQLASATLTAATGTIVATVKAVNLSLSAATGIGSSGTPISTQVNNLVAKTGTGGIFISNTGNLAIGFVGEPFAGVKVTSASGDIVLTNAGTISLNRLDDIVKGPGNVNINANGAAADLLIGTGNGLLSPGGSGSIVSSGTASTVAVEAGRDVLVGNPTLGNVESAGSIVLTAGRNINVDADSFVEAHGTGTLTATAGGNLSLLQTFGVGAHLSSQGGAISLTAGAGGTFTANSGNGGSVQTAGNGPITISADDMVISSDTISAGSAVVTLQQATTSARNIDLGGGTTAGDLGLGDAELGKITAGTLRVGRTDNPGNISVTAPVTAHAGYATLSLQTGGAIIDNNATEPDVRVTNLALRAANGISLDTAVSNLAFSNAAGVVIINNTGALVLNAVDGLSTSSNTGTITELAAISGPITFAVNITSARDLSAVTTETASETGTPLPPPDDGIFVNPGVTVQSTVVGVVMVAADSIVINSTAQVLAPSNGIRLLSGSGDNDNDAAMTLNGTVAANAASGTVSVEAAGAITQGAGGQITASNLCLLAATGIGSSGTPLSSQANNLVAKTGTGGIFISNTGNLAIGFVSEPFAGVQVTGASGDIHLTNAGSITVSRFNDVVQTSGNIVINAMGATSDVLLSTNNGVATPPSIGSVISSGSASTVSVAAGRDVLLGNAAGMQVGNVQSAGSIVLTAGRNINVDADSFVDAHGAGTLTATAGGNISLLQNAFQGAHLSSQGGAISLTTGAGGTFTANSGTGGSVATTQAGGNGPITISADDMVISSDTISAGSGVVTFQQATTSARNIDLGGGTTAGDLGLSDAELGHVTAGVLRIGRTDNAGNISVTTPVTAHAGYAMLSLQTGGAIIDNNATEPDVRVTNLALRAANGISLDTAASNLAFGNTAGAVGIRNTGALTINVVDGLTSSTNNGTTTALSAASPITFAVNTTSAGTLTATANETLPAVPNLDNVAVNPGVTVQSTGGDVVLLAGDNIVINGTAQVLAPTGNIDLRSGFGDNDNEGTMTLNGTVAANAATGTVALNVNVPNAAATEAATGTISGAGLLLLNFPASGGLFSLDASTTNSVKTIAATTNAAISFRNAAALTAGTVTSSNEGVTTFGIFTSNHDVTLSTAMGDITLSQAINAGATAVIRVQSAGGLSQTASSPLTAAGLSVAAAGNVTLNQPANSIGMFAGSLSGGGSALYLATSGAFTVGAISGDTLVPPRTGIFATGNVTLVPGSGILTISQDVSGATVTLSPQAGGVHQTAGAITASALVQSAGAVPSVYAGSIFTAAGGMQLTGSDFSVTGPINLNSGPLTMSDTGAATISGQISGSGGLVMNGPGTLTLAAANTYAAPTTVTAGTLIIAAAGALPAVQNVVNNGALRINANAGPGPITGAGSLSVSAATLTTPSFSQEPVTIQGIGVIKLQGAFPMVSNASLLSIDAASKLDLTTNMLRVNYSGGSDPIAAIRSYLLSGYAGGTWTGAGIATSAGDATHALGFGDSADGIVPGLPANTLLIRWTRYGDVNLDGAVGFADLLTVARNYGKSGRNWDQGDMNYDGAVDFGDLVTVARNYGATAAVQPATAMLVAAPIELSIKKRRGR